MQIIKKMFFVFLISCCFVASVSAGGKVSGARELTQLAQLAADAADRALQYAKMVEQYKVQYETLLQNYHQVEMMLQNLRQLDPTSWNGILNSITSIDNLLNRSLSVTYAASNLEESFRELYPEYNDWAKNWEKENGHIVQRDNYKKIAEETQATTKATLQSLGIKLEDIKDSEDLLNKLRAQSKNADGQLKVTQATNELIAHQISRLNSMHETLLIQSQMMTKYIADKNAQELGEKNAEELLHKEKPGDTTISKFRFK